MKSIYHFVMLSLSLLTSCLPGCTAELNDEGVDDANPKVAAIAFQGLGDLPGGDFDSHAFGVSTDGTTVVGSSYSKDGENEAFRWTQLEGMTGLGDLQGERPRRFNSRADAASRNGKVIVGSGTPGSTKAFRWVKVDDMRKTVVGAGYSAVGSEAVRWTNSGGVESIQKLLMDRGVDMTGWRLWIATDLSSDGSVIVGYAINPAQKWEAWRADLSIHPARDSK